MAGVDADRAACVRENWRDLRHPNGTPVFSLDGTMLNDKGSRSIFDDVDE